MLVLFMHSVCLWGHRVWSICAARHAADKDHARVLAKNTNWGCQCRARCCVRTSSSHPSRPLMPLRASSSRSFLVSSSYAWTQKQKAAHAHVLNVLEAACGSGEWHCGRLAAAMRHKCCYGTGGVLQQRHTMALLRPEGQLVPSILHCWCTVLVVVSLISSEACCSRLETIVTRAHSKTSLECRCICTPSKQLLVGTHVDREINQPLSLQAAQQLPPWC